MKPPSADGTWWSAEHRFSLEEPTAAGHFPGDPIIPGALLLDHVLRAIGRQAPMTMPLEIQAAKFRRPVRPGDEITIRWRPQPSGAVMFECWVAGRAEMAPEEMALSGSVKARQVP